MFIDYKCNKCDYIWYDVTRKIDELSTPIYCPECGAEMSRLYKPLVVRFKGDGWGGDYTYQRWPEKTKKEHYDLKTINKER